MEIERFYKKEEVAPVPKGARRLSYEEVDELYDLVGINGFHGRSCDRWAPHFEFYEDEPLSSAEGDGILRED